MNDRLVLKTPCLSKSQSSEGLANRIFGERLFVRQITIPDRCPKKAARVRNVPDAQTSRREHPLDLGKKIECLLPRKVLQHVEQRHHIDALLVAGTKAILGFAQLYPGDAQPVRQFNLLPGTICSPQIAVAFPAKKVQERTMSTADVHNARFAIPGEMFADHRLKVGSATTEKFFSRTARILDLTARYIGLIQNCLPGIQFPILCSVFFLMLRKPCPFPKTAFFRPLLPGESLHGADRAIAAARTRCYHDDTATLASPLA